MLTLIVSIVTTLNQFAICRVLTHLIFLDIYDILGPSRSSDSHTFSYEALRPTYTHEAICKLVHLGYLKHVISQNTDGLHRLSGVPVEQLSELHGTNWHVVWGTTLGDYGRRVGVMCVGD